MSPKAHQTMIAIHLKLAYEHAAKAGLNYNDLYHMFIEQSEGRVDQNNRFIKEPYPCSI